MTPNNSPPGKIDSICVNSFPSLFQRPLADPCDTLPFVSSIRLLSAYFSLWGTIYSPNITPITTSNKIGLRTTQTMRKTETPAALITINSELLAKLPKPTRQPMSAAIGRNSYILPGVVNTT